MKKYVIVRFPLPDKRDIYVFCLYQFFKWHWYSMGGTWKCVERTYSQYHALEWRDMYKVNIIEYE